MTARRDVPQPRPQDVLIDELQAWALSRAMPDVDGEWAAGYEHLRNQLLSWIEERRAVVDVDPDGRRDSS